MACWCHYSRDILVSLFPSVGSAVCLGYDLINFSLLGVHLNLLGYQILDDSPEAQREVTASFCYSISSCNVLRHATNTNIARVHFIEYFNCLFHLGWQVFLILLARKVRQILVQFIHTSSKLSQKDPFGCLDMDGQIASDTLVRV